MKSKPNNVLFVNELQRCQSYSYEVQNRSVAILYL